MGDPIKDDLRRVIELKERGDVAALISELRNPAQRGDVAPSAWAARYLGDLRAEAAAPSLRPLLADDTVYGRISAAYALGSIGDRAAVPAILELLDDPNTLLRGWATMALGEIGDRSVIPHLLPLLHHRRWHVRSAAIYALTLIDEPESRTRPPLSTDVNGTVGAG